LAQILRLIKMLVVLGKTTYFYIAQQLKLIDMRTLFTSLKKTFPIVVSGVLVLILSACGTQNQKYSSSDGVYASESAVAVNNAQEEVDKTNY
jgi:hypothetical protein